jgi:hypothetical protein
MPDIRMLNIEFQAVDPASAAGRALRKPATEAPVQIIAMPPLT